MPLLVILEVVYSVTDPPIKALRRVIPPLRIGSIALDLSFLIVLVAAYMLLRVNATRVARGDLKGARVRRAPSAGVRRYCSPRQNFLAADYEWVRSCR